MDVRAVIMAGGAGERLSVLSDHRAKPAVPFGGKWRIIDFALSNCVNSGIEDILVLTQYSPRSLMDHIGSGRPWDLDRRHKGGVRLLQPYLSRTDHSGWYQGTADAVRRNMKDVVDGPPELVLILAGDHIYTMDYRPFIATHVAKGAALTIAVLDVPREEATRMGIAIADEDDRIVDWEEKPAEPRSTLASMGIYVFDPGKLAEYVTAQRHDFGKDVIPAMLAAGEKVVIHRFEGYWRDVGTVEAYWAANLDLVALVPQIDLFDPTWRIHTRQEYRSPAKAGPYAVVRHSLVSEGCIVNGSVENSVLSPGVRVLEGAHVRDSVVMTDAVIGPGAVVDTAIVDKGCVIGEGAVVGWGEDRATVNELEPDRLTSGITVVGKYATVPGGVLLGRNVRVDALAGPDDYGAAQFVPSGSTIRHPVPNLDDLI